MVCWCAVKWAKGHIQYKSETELPFRDHWSGHISTWTSVVLDENLGTVRYRGWLRCALGFDLMSHILWREETSWKRTLRSVNYKCSYWSPVPAAWPSALRCVNVRRLTELCWCQMISSHWRFISFKTDQSFQTNSVVILLHLIYVFVNALSLCSTSLIKIWFTTLHVFYILQQ